ncbi:hypothetical protein [Streptomyces sp. NPDC048623]|uniref:hypothetical protein n=1 Tax=Streptomyces sp. NPDC048623 TaxID=3155761 RepID=UPI00343131FA
MDLDALRFGVFTQLGTAAGDWEAMAKKLRDLETDARDDLGGKAAKANWEGVNATVTKEFVGKTAKEFADAATQAESIANILKDTHGELVGYKKQLNDTIEQALTRNLTVVGTGDGGFTVTMNIHPDRAAKGHEVPEHTQADVNALRDEVQKILTQATESDTTAAQALTMLVSQTPYGFSDAAYYDRDSAAKAMKDAEEIANLLKKKGDDLTPEQFDRLNKDLAAYKDDRLFQEKLATTLGPRGVLEFWADLSDPSDGGGLQRARLKDLGDFQQNLSFVLAGATQSDSPAMRTWENDMVKLGDQRIETRGGQAYGYQLMSNLMRTGDWDNRFLNAYGNALVATEKKMKVPDRFYLMEPTLKMNFIGDAEFGRDPIAGFMAALANSPDAATDFFNAKEPQDNAQWVLKDRPSFDDSPLKDGPNETLEATGRAMFAAVSGVTDLETGAQYEEHTPEQREAMKRSLGILASSKNDFPPELRDSMAYAMGNHGDWVHEAMSDPIGRHELDAGQLMEVSKQISRNRDDYQTLTQVMHQSVVADILTEKAHPEDSLDRAGRTIGFLEEARYQATNADKGEALADASWKKAWRYHIVGGLITPWSPAMDSVQRGVDLITSKMLEDEQNRINDQATADHTKTYENRSQELRGLADLWYTQNKDWAEDPTHEGYSKDHGIYSQIEGAANDGNKKAEGVGGIQ